MAPLALPLHMRETELAGQKHPFHIDIHQPVPVFFADFDRPAHFDNADVIVKDVDSAIGLDARPGHLLNSLGIGHVGLEGSALSPFLLDDALGFLCGLQVVIDKKYLSPFAGIKCRRRLPVSPAGTDRAGPGDQRNFSFYTICHQYLTLGLLSCQLLLCLRERDSPAVMFGKSVNVQLLVCRAE